MTFTNCPRQNAVNRSARTDSATKCTPWADQTYPIRRWHSGQGAATPRLI